MWLLCLLPASLVAVACVAGVVSSVALSALLAGGADRPGLDLAAIGRMFARLTERHTERMAELGLDA